MYYVYFIVNGLGLAVYHTYGIQYECMKSFHHVQCAWLQAGCYASPGMRPAECSGPGSEWYGGRSCIWPQKSTSYYCN